MRIPKKTLDERIPQAINLIRNSFPGGPNMVIKISKTDKGHSNAFGANMVMSSPLMAAILLKKNAVNVYQIFGELFKIQIASTSTIDLIDYLTGLAGNVSSKVRMDLAVTTVALKMALRTFPEL